MNILGLWAFLQLELFPYDTFPEVEIRGITGMCILKATNVCYHVIYSSTPGTIESMFYCTLASIGC